MLAVLFDAPERSFYMGEVIALAQSGTGAVQRELADMAAAGILSVHRQGKQKHYQANTNSPVFVALRDLVSKSVGVANVLRAALQPVTRQFSAAFFHEKKSIAKGNQVPVVHVALFCKTLADGAVASSVAQALQTASNTLARQLKFTLHSPETLAIAMAQSNTFLPRLMAPTKTWLKGSEDNLFGKAR